MELEQFLLLLTVSWPSVVSRPSTFVAVSMSEMPKRYIHSYLILVSILTNLQIVEYLVAHPKVERVISFQPTIL